MTPMIRHANLRFGSSVVPLRQVDTIVVHHAAAPTCSAEDIHRWHLAKGWAGCGYHYVVRKDGSVWAARPREWAGAHVLGHNSHTLAVCLEGNFNEESPPLEQLEALLGLISFLWLIYGRRLKCCGHRDLAATDCPGKRFPIDLKGVA